MASKSGKVGFVGGMDIPLIRRFQCGYEQGIKYANPNAELIANMTGTTPAAWNDPGRGAELAKGQFDRGVDVVYAAAGTPASACCRPPRTAASSASASIPTRTTCIPAPC